MSFRLAFAVAIASTAFSGAALADQYPIAGAWASFDPSQPKLAGESCASYQRDPKKVIGNVVVFQGTKKVEFNGGYLEEETVTNISVQKIGPNEFRVTDRFYDDGEGRSKPGYGKRMYRLTFNDGKLLIAEGKYPPSQYVACAADRTLVEASSETVKTPSPASDEASPSADVKPTEIQSVTPTLHFNQESNKSGTWPLGTAIKATDAAMLKIIERLRVSSGKNDLLGLSPGMTYVEALKILTSVRDIVRPDGRCEVFAFSPEVIAEFARRAQSLSCVTKDGRLTAYFTPNLATKRVNSVELDFPSGASATEMIENVTDRYGGTPKDFSERVNCDAVQDNGIGFPMAVYRKANGDYDRCRKENEQRKNRLVKWALPDGLVVTLERQERYYDDVSNAGFKLKLDSPEIGDVNQRANQANTRSLNSQPELTTSRKDLVGIVPGMRYDQIIQVITAHGYYIRPLSQAPAVDALGHIMPYCSDPDEISNRRGSQLRCTQTEEQQFELEFGFTGALTSPILSSVQLSFESGLDEMTAYISDQFGALPTKVTNYENAKAAVWSLPPRLVLSLQQTERRKWNVSLSDLSISEADKKAAEDAQRLRNVRPKF